MEDFSSLFPAFFQRQIIFVRWENKTRPGKREHFVVAVVVVAVVVVVVAIVGGSGGGDI